MWEIVRVSSSTPNGVSEYLAKGYEPFAVTVDPISGYDIIWLKKRKKEEVKK